ncbi:hypothetical protein AB0J35_43305 [Nonomuraea angiospora]|uniref:hypothetical protein n=1 Tax=Nonomuraea angiospora TaxID=46172 RepID=UPI00341310A1
MPAAVLFSPAVDLSADDAERINDAIVRACAAGALAGALTIGLQREADDSACPRWAEGVRELVDRAPCLSVGVLADDPEPCQLFDGHPGNHSFDPGAAPIHLLSAE